MLTLCGFSASNYYNKVKLALLKRACRSPKNWPGWARPTAAPARWAGALPAHARQGPLCESAVMADYIEAAHPEHPLIPADPTRPPRCAS